LVSKGGSGRSECSFCLGNATGKFFDFSNFLRREMEVRRTHDPFDLLGAARADDRTGDGRIA